MHNAFIDFFKIVVFALKMLVTIQNQIEIIKQTFFSLLEQKLISFIT